MNNATKTPARDCERCDGTGVLEASDFSGDTIRCPDCEDGQVPCDDDSDRFEPAPLARAS